MEYINSYIELHANHEAISSFLYNLHKFHEMSEEIFKCHCIHLHLKLNSDLNEIDLYQNWSLKKIVLWESSALDVLKFISCNNWPEMNPNVVTA